MKHRAKWVTIAVAVIGTATLLVWAGVEVRQRRLEEQANREFREASNDLGKKEAARLLGEMKSLRAIPSLLGQIQEERWGRGRSALHGLIEKNGFVYDSGEGDTDYLETAVRKILDRQRSRAVPVLVRLLESSDAVVQEEAGVKWVQEVREEAARWLAEIGPEAAAAIPGLKAALRRSPPVETAAEALIEIGFPGEELLPELIDLLQKSAGKGVINAIKLLGKNGKEAIPALLGRSGPGTDPARSKLAALLALLGPEAVVPLCDLVLNEREVLCDAVIPAILKLKAGDTVPILMSIVDDEEAWNFVWELSGVLRALERIGPEARIALPALIRRAKRMKEQELDGVNWGKTRFHLILALGSIGGDSPEVLAVLEKALLDEESVSAAAAKALARLGSAAAPSSPSLEVIARDDFLPAKAWAKCALAKIDRSRVPGVVTEMVGVLARGKTQEAVSFAGEVDLDDTPAEVLGEMGPAAREAVPALLDLCRPLLERGDGIALRPLLRALSMIGLDAPYLPLFTDLLRHPDPARRNLALRLLNELGPSARPAIPAIKEALRDGDREVRFLACLGLLLKHEPSAPEAIPVLQEMLRARERRYRSTARQLLDKNFGKTSESGR